MGVIRSLLSLIALIAFVVFATTVPLGSRTLFGHLSRIWQAPATQELVDGVKETSKPVVDKVARGVSAGIEELQKDEAEKGSSSNQGDEGSKKTEPEQTPTKEQVVDAVADKAGEVAREAAKREVKEQLGGGR